MGFLNRYLGYILCSGLIGACVFYKVHIWHHMKLKKVFRNTLIGSILIILMLQVPIYSQLWSEVPEDKPVDVLIVLGAGLRGENVSTTLASRLDAAADYVENNSETKIIVSGGQGADELISEALAMKRYLLDKGVSEEMILMENQSTSTEENLKFSKLLLPGSGRIGVVTSNYHMFRAKFIAEKHFEAVEGISAKSPLLSLGNYMIRESIAIVNEWRKDML